MKSMHDLMLHFLQDIYYAEKKGVSNAKKTAKAVDNAELKEAILQHGEQSKTQVERLATAFESLNRRPRGKTCAAMDGLVKECEEAIEEGEKGPILDSALLACAQAIEHYEIARYGALLAWAKASDNGEAAAVIEEILAEEKAADARLSDIANSILNPEAAEETEDDEEEEDEDEPDESPAMEAPVEAPAEEEEEEEEPKPAPKRRSAKTAAPAPAKAAAPKAPAAKPAPAPAAKPAPKSRRKSS